MFSQEASGGRNGRTAWLRGLARPAALAVVLLSMLAAAPAPPMRPHRLPVPRGGWASWLRRVLGLPRGEADYLPEYRRLYGALWGRAGILRVPNRPTTSKQVFRRIQRNAEVLRLFREIEHKITVQGVPANLLRDAVLRHSHLSSPAGPYGRYWHRLGLAEDFFTFSNRLRAAGRNRQSSEYYKVFLFLLAQDDARGGVMAWASAWKQAASFLSIPGIGQKFKKIEARAMAGYQYPWRLAGDRFDRLVESWPESTRGGARGNLKLLKSLFWRWQRLINGQIHSEWMFAHTMLTARGTVAERGDLAAAAALRRWFGEWAAIVRRGKDRRSVDRSALLRWIKEAMWP